MPGIQGQMDPTPGRPGWGFWGRLTPRPSPLFPQSRDLEVPPLAPPALAFPLWVICRQPALILSQGDYGPGALGWHLSPCLTAQNQVCVIVSFLASLSQPPDPGLATGYSHGDSERTGSVRERTFRQ